MRDDGGSGGGTGRTGQQVLADLPREELFRTLADPHRRYVLGYLRAVDRPVPVPELAERVATARVDGEPVSRRDTVEVATSLHHVHLPRLVGLDLVEWVDDRRAVRTTDRGDALPAAIPWLPADRPEFE